MKDLGNEIIFGMPHGIQPNFNLILREVLEKAFRKKYPIGCIVHFEDVEDGYEVIKIWSDENSVYVKAINTNPDAHKVEVNVKVE